MGDDGGGAGSVGVKSGGEGGLDGRIADVGGAIADFELADGPVHGDRNAGDLDSEGVCGKHLPDGTYKKTQRQQHRDLGLDDATKLLCGAADRRAFINFW